MTTPLVVVSAGESERSRTDALAGAALARAGGDRGGRFIALADLDPAGLLGRVADPEVDDALAAVAGARRLVLATPVYRATYAGLLKVLLDRLAYQALARTAVVLVATAGSRDHYLSLDTGLRPVAASLGAWTAPTVVYATPDDFDDERRPLPPILEVLDRALAEADSLAAALG